MENYLQRLSEIWGADPTDPSAALAWISNCVANQIEEGLYLDFKQKSDVKEASLNDDDKANLAKSISGFANTDGGFIIWGVKAKAQSKEDPDVATALAPISRLKVFQTQLNSVAGSVVIPPVPGVENRVVQLSPSTDTGYVITVVPRRRDTLTQANSKTCKGFYIRSGSGFHQLPEPLIAEFYRRKPSPLVSHHFELAPPEKASFTEEQLEAQHTDFIVGEIRGWGHCRYRQFLSIPWQARLSNTGLASANQLVFSLTISSDGPWSILNFSRDRDGSLVPIYAPVPMESFEAVKSHNAIGRSLEPLHPGQQTNIAHGEIRIPFEAFDSEIPTIELTGSVYAADSAPFPIQISITGDLIKNSYLQAFQAIKSIAPPAERDVPRRGRSRPKPNKDVTRGNKEVRIR